MVTLLRLVVVYLARGREERGERDGESRTIQILNLQLASLQGTNSFAGNSEKILLSIKISHLGQWKKAVTKAWAAQLI